MSIEPIKFVLPPIETPLLKGGVSYTETSSANSSQTFGSFLEKAVNNLKDVHNLAAQQMNEYASGGNIDISEVMLTLEKTQLQTDLAVQVRNKLIDGYQEILRMQI